MKIIKTALIILLAFVAGPVFSQSNQTLQPEQRWQHDDPTDKNGSWGVASGFAYQTILKDRKTTTVIVAVIDGGVDTSHPDLKNNLWINPGEIPGNGIDDDHNGYIDDIHGWNFIGGPSGDVGQESTEAVRIFKKLDPKFKGKTASQISKSDKAEFQLYNKVNAKIQSELASSKVNLEMYSKLKSEIERIISMMGDTDFTEEELRQLKSDDEDLSKVITGIADAMRNEVSFNKIQKDITEGYDYFNTTVNYHYNIDFDARKIVGDNPDEYVANGYGNNNVTGPDALHGTHVAGIIGAVRDNGIGIDGIASDVKIMCLRAVPDGDERDKDVANAIRYAADNGARVINMSFGKSYSPGRKYVEEAILYATKKDVLMIHAAGNDAMNNDKGDNFPNVKSLDTKENPIPWIEVGAIDANGNVADFSNYGKKTVDILAPGVSVYSTLPGGNYDFESGTSMASPAVAGVAALIRSVYPELTALQVRSAILKGVVKPSEKTNIPGKTKKIKYKNLCKTGGATNAIITLMVARDMDAGSK